MCKSNKFVKNLIKLYIKKSYLYTKYGAYNQKNTTIYGVFFVWWAGLDSNQRRRSRRIYSPLHLAALQPTHKLKALLWCFLELVKGIEPSTC